MGQSSTGCLSLAGGGLSRGWGWTFSGLGVDFLRAGGGLSRGWRRTFSGLGEGFLGAGGSRGRSSAGVPGKEAATAVEVVTC